MLVANKGYAERVADMDTEPLLDSGVTEWIDEKRHGVRASSLSAKAQQDVASRAILSPDDYSALVESVTDRWRKVLFHNSGDELAILYCAANTLLLGRHDVARDYLALLPDSSAINNKQKFYEIKAKLATETGNYTQAIECWKYAAENGYDQNQGKLRIAAQYLQSGDLANARRHAYAAEGGPEVIEYSMIILARCLVHEKAWGAAIELLKEYQSYLVHREAAAELVYRCYLNDFQYENALSVCPVFRDSSESKYLLYKGKVKVRQNRYNQAIRCFEKAFELSGQVGTKIWTIKAMTAAHDHEAAVKQAEIAEHTLTDDSLTKGMIWEAAGVLSTAEQWYKQAVSESHTYLAYSTYIQFLFNNRNWGEAYKLLNQARTQGIEATALDSLRNEIQRAFAVSRWKSPLKALLPGKAEFYSSESMVKAIVDRKGSIHPAVVAGGIESGDSNVVLVIGSLGAGGAERQVVNLANGLVDSEGVRAVTLLCTHLSRLDQDRFYAPEVDTRVLTEEYYKRDEILEPDSIPELASYSDLLRHIQPLSRLQVILHLARALVEIKPSVVHGWLDETFINTALVCHMLGIRNVVGRWGSMPPGVNRTVSEKSASNIRYLQYAYQQISRLPHLKYSSNSRLTAIAYSELLKINRNKVHIVYNGVNEGKLAVASKSDEAGLRCLWNIPEEAIVVGTVFRISEEKRPFLWVDVAIQLTTRLPDLHFVIVGGGPLENQITDYISSKQADNIHMIGRQSNVGPWYRLFDLLLLTSRVEGVSNVVLESQFCGCPVVAPNVGGLSEAMLDGKTGLLLEDHSVLSFAEAVERLLTDKTLLKESGENARRFAREQFSIDKMVSTYQLIYQQPVN